MAHDRNRTLRCVIATIVLLMFIGTTLAPISMGEGWLKVSIADTHKALTLIDAGDVDRDGADEIYAVSYKGAIIKVHFTGSHWTEFQLPVTAPDWAQAMVIGDVDQDDYDEIYVASRHSSDHGRIYQVTSNGFTWTRNIIYNNFAPGDYPMDMVMGDANRNGIMELYYIEAGGGLKFIYRTGSSWSGVTIDTSYPGYFRCIAVGDGNNDGQPELYVGTDTNRVFQYTYSGGIWSDEEIGYGGFDGYWEYIKDIIVGDPDNDDDNAVYAVAGDRYLEVFEYEGGAWNGDNIIEIYETSTINQLALGDGDDDGYAELFAVHSDHRVYYYHYDPNLEIWRRIQVDHQMPEDSYSIVVAEADGQPDYMEIYAACENGEVYKFSKDVTPPIAPRVWSPTHPQEVWKNETVINVQWEMLEDDESGIKGFSYLWTTDGLYWPDTALDIGSLEHEMDSPEMPDGSELYFSIRAVDNADNWGPMGSHGPMFIDTTSPYDLKVTINDGVEFTSTQWVTLTVSARDDLSGPENMSFSNDEQNWSDWVPYEPTYSSWDMNWRSPGGITDGVRTVYMRIQDEAGNIGYGGWDDIYLDQSPPTNLDLKINNGQKYTNDPMVDLKVYAMDPTGGSKLAYMAFSNNNEAWSDWEIYNTEKPYWSLVQGHGGKDKDGKKKVYFRTKDLAGNLGGPVSSNIILDRVPPSNLDVIINSGTLVAKNTTLSLQLKGVDDPDHSGMGEYALKEEGHDWTDWDAWTSRTEFEISKGDGSKFLYMKAKDKAGNEAEPVRSFVILGRKAPRISHIRVLGITDKNAVVMWTTDIPANGVVRYGTSVNYNAERHHSDLLTRHSVTLSGLRPSTDYHFSVESTDAAGSTPTTSRDMTFTTRDIPDNLPPTITDLRIEGVSHNTAVIRWKTNEPSDTRIRYGPTPQYGMVTGNSKDILEHRVLLTGLKKDTLYYFTASSSDPRGNGPTEISGTFRTMAIVDVEAPTITNLNVIGITDSLAIVTWQTNEPSLSIIEYGTTMDYGTVAVSEKYVKVHRVVLTGLSMDTMYHLVVRAMDTNGNGPTTSDDYVFFTTRVPDRTAPVITNVRAEAITSNSAVISWATDEPADSGVEYFASETLAGESVYDLDMVETHSVPLSNLNPNTEYSFRVVSWDASGNGPSSSSYLTFKTSDTADIDAPIISNLTVDGITDSLAIVMWSTDEETTGFVEYGAESGIYIYHVEEEGYLKEHGIVLWDLQPGTSYFARVQCTDVGGNGPTISKEVRFVTTTHPDSLPPTISDLLVTEVSYNTATISWRTDEPANSFVWFGKGGANDNVAKDARYLYKHEMTLQNLEPNTTYTFYVTSKDPTKNEGQSDELTFTTLEEYVPPPPPPPPPPPNGTPGTSIEEAAPWAALLIILIMVVALVGYMHSKGLIGTEARRKKRAAKAARTDVTAAHHRHVAAARPHGAPAHPLAVAALTDDGLCPHCRSHISLNAAAKEAAEEKRREQERQRREAEARRRRMEAEAKHRRRMEDIDRKIGTMATKKRKKKRKVHAPLPPPPSEAEGFEELPEKGHHDLEDLYDEVEEEEDAVEAEVIDDTPGDAWEAPRSPILADLGKEPEEYEEAAKEPLKTVKCGNCGSRVPVYTHERPVKIKCPSCDKSGVLKGK